MIHGRVKASMDEALTIVMLLMNVMIHVHDDEEILMMMECVTKMIIVRMYEILAK